MEHLERESANLRRRMKSVVGFPRAPRIFVAHMKPKQQNALINGGCAESYGGILW